MDRSDKQRIEGIVQRILDDFGDDRAINKTDLCNEPDKTAIIDVIDKLMKILYPGYYSDKLYKIYSLKNNMSVIIEDVIFHLKKQIMIVLRYCKKFPELTDAELEDKAMDITYEFMDKIPQIRDYLETEILLRAARMRSYFHTLDCMPYLYTVWHMSFVCWMCR